MRRTNQKINFLSTILSKGWESCRGYSFKDSGSGAGMTAESGRSMVEMLGVLAIVGVISIGGVAGYNYGMNRYRTNELLDGANKRAYTVATQMTLGIPLNLSEFADYDATAGGTFKSDVTKGDNGEFGIKVEGVKKEVCENILRMIGDNTPLRALSKGEGESEQELQSGGCEDGDTNAFSFVYNVEMLSKGAKPSSPSGTSSIGGGSASSSAPVCAKNGEACTSSADCCDDNCNSSGYCGDEGCLENGETTDLPGECCGVYDWNTGRCVSCVENGYELYNGASAADCCSGQKNAYSVCGERPECIPNGERADLWPGITCCSGIYAIPDIGPTCVECIPEGVRGTGSCCEG